MQGEKLESIGCCPRHPDICKKKLQGGWKWKVRIGQCPECCLEEMPHVCGEIEGMGHGEDDEKQVKTETVERVETNDGDVSLNSERRGMGVNHVHHCEEEKREDTSTANRSCLGSMVSGKYDLDGVVTFNAENAPIMVKFNAGNVPNTDNRLALDDKAVIPDLDLSDCSRNLDLSDYSRMDSVKMISYDQKEHKNWLHQFHVWSVACGGMLATPFMLSALPILFLLCLTIVGSFVVVPCLLVLLLMTLFPIMMLLSLGPKPSLCGHQDLAVVCKNYCKNNDPNEEKKEEPLLIELERVMALSDFVYYYIDFRRLSIVGKIPIPFKHIMLECDHMNQSDLIDCVPHKQHAFLPDGTPTGIGIQPSALLVTALRFLVAEAERHIITKVTMRSQHSFTYRRSTKTISSSSKSSIFGRASSRWSTVEIFGKTSSRRSTIGPVERELEKQKAYEGLLMYEDLFSKSLIHCPKECNHESGGTLCKYSGMHACQCFIDELEKHSEKGDEDCEELLHILSEDIDEETFDDDVARVTALLRSIAHTGKIFKKNSIAFASLNMMNDNDTRIVWTNDRHENYECIYIIAVSYRLRRVTVIFRGTQTLSDILKDCDFNVMTKPSPVQCTTGELNDEIELNQGYSDYLFSERDDTGRTKFDEIADRVEMIGSALGDGNYSLHVTGHSMGGSLAVLFGFYASTDDRFAQDGNPVCVYSFAAAISGRISFVKAFQHQEKMGKLQHLRITQSDDIVPLYHFQTERNFAHTGVSMCFHSDKKLPSVRYHEDVDWWGTLSANILTNVFVNFPWMNPLSAFVSHSMNSHVDSVKKAEPEMINKGLGGVTLSDLYAIMNVNGTMN